MAPLVEQLATVLNDQVSDPPLVSTRGSASCLRPNRSEDELVLRAQHQIYANVPLAWLSDVHVRRKVIVRIEDELESFDGTTIDLAQASISSYPDIYTLINDSKMAGLWKILERADGVSILTRSVTAMRGQIPIRRP